METGENAENQTGNENRNIPETKGNEPIAQNQQGNEQNNLVNGNEEQDKGGKLPPFAQTLQKNTESQQENDKNTEKQGQQETGDEFAQWLEKYPAEMTDAQKATFWQKMGKPENADGYELPKDDRLNFKEIAFSNNLSKAQAKSIYDSVSKAGLEFVKAQQAADEKQIAETEKYLRDTYGDKYDEKITLMQKGIEAFGGVSLLNKLKSSGLLFDRDIVQQYITIGEMTAESGSFSRGINGGNNGYVSPLDGGLMKF